MGRLKAMPPRVGALPPRVAAMPKVADRFYQSAEWMALRERRKLDLDYIQAQARAKRDGSRRLILDHVIEIKDGGAPLDPANTAWLTFREHQVKTARARGRRASGGTQQRGGGAKPGRLAPS